jgi:YD repeat-containing protein
MVSTLVAALAAAHVAACPTPTFVPHDGALRLSSTDVASAGDGPALKRSFTTSLPFRGQFGMGFGIEEELRVEPLAGGALRVTVPGPCPACAAAIPEASPDTLAEGVRAAARTLVASGASALADEAAAYSAALDRDPAYRQAEWSARREAWLRAAREEPADKLERLPVAARFRVVRLSSGYLRYADGAEVQELDREGRLLRVVNAGGLVRDVQRDAAGRIVRVADAQGRGFTLELDGSGRVARAVGSDGTVVRYGYDAAGRLSWTEDRDGRTELGWDEAGRVVRLACGERVVAATYETAAEGGRVVSLRDSDGVRERYLYQGSAGGLFRAVNVLALPDGAEPSTAPGDVARPVALDEPRELRRYTFVEPMTSDGRRWTWQATEEEAGDAKVTIYDDRTFQPVSVAASDRVARFEYDGLGRLVRKEVEGEITSLSYGPEGKIAHLERHAPAAEGGSASLDLRYAYDAHAHLLRAEGGQDAARLTYDERGRITTIVATSDGTERKVALTYAKGDRPIRIEVQGVGAVVVEYDEHGEVSKVDASEGRKASLEVTLAFQTLLDLVRPASVKMDVW